MSAGKSVLAGIGAVCLALAAIMIVAFLNKLPQLSSQAYHALVASSGGHREHDERQGHMAPGMKM